MSALAGAGLGLSQRLGSSITDQLKRWGVPTPWYRRGAITSTYTVCDMCPWRCGVIVRSVDGEVVKIDGNPADPKSRGKLCARGQGGVSFRNDPDRLTTPLIRTGARGSGEFRQASWEEALDEIATRMLAISDESGPESIAFLGHTGGDHWFTDYLAQAWGSPNAAKPSSSLCTSPREEAANLTLGHPIGGHEPVDWDFIDCITLIGSHIGEDSRNTLMQDFSAARARGAEVIVVDPRFSTAASKADRWLPIRPGTDTALLLAWMNVLIEENLYDAAYIDRWTSGFDRLADHVSDLTPEWAGPITDLDPGAIRQAARMMAAAAPSSAIMPGRHVTWYGNDTQRLRAEYLVNALLGAWGRQGGFYLNRSPYIEAYPHPAFAVAGSSGGCSADAGEEAGAELPLGPSGKARADGVRETFLRGPTALQELIEPMIDGDPYPIRGLIAYGINLLHSIPDRDRTIRALENLDLVVVIDVLAQDHVAWADVVLPDAVYLERADDLSTMAYKTPWIAIRDQAVEPVGEAKPPWWIARELGVRLGLDKFFRWETIDEWNDTRLRSIGKSLEKLRAEGGVVVQEGAPYLEDVEASPFHTASGRIELYSEALAAAGHDPMPVYEPVEQPPDGFFRLLYGRHPAHTFAKTQNTPALSHLYPENEVWVNAGAARVAGISEGDRVRLVNQDGAVEGPVRANITERIRPDAVYMVHGYGHRAPGMSLADRRGASDTALQTRYALDPISGGAGMRVNFVRLERAT